jgi:hypothetical protein
MKNERSLRENPRDVPLERQRKIKKRAAELIAEEYTLRDLRKAKRMT